MTARTSFIAAILLIAFAAPAHAGLLCEYTARLSSQDHFNSRGARLNAVAAVIRQDRYYFHVEGAGDPEDEGDCFFADKRNRELLERMIANGRVTARARRAIVDGTPMIRVRIYREGGRDYVDVDVF